MITVLNFKICWYVRIRMNPSDESPLVAPLARTERLQSSLDFLDTLSESFSEDGFQLTIYLRCATRVTASLG
jgi:hypothetical protein